MDILSQSQPVANPPASSTFPPAVPPPPPMPNPVSHVTTPSSPPKPTASPLIVPSVSSAPPPPPPPPPDQTQNAASHAPKKRKLSGIVIAVIILLILSIPISAFFISQSQQLADLRGRAVAPYVCPGGFARCPEGQCSNVYPGDVCGTLGETRCNGGLLATCTKLSSFCSLNYWKAMGTCVNNTPVPYASVTIKPLQSPTPSGMTRQCQNGTQNRDQNFWLICECANGCKEKPDNTPGSGGTGWVCDDNCKRVPIGTRPQGTCTQIDYVHEGTSDYCGVAEINCPTSCQTNPQPTNPPSNPTSPPSNPTATSKPPNTPTRPPASQCQNIKVYKNNALITDLTTLKAGDQVVLGVKGANSTKGRFRVNGAPPNFQETTGVNSSGEFTLSFTIPSGVTNFQIEAEVKGQDGVWK